MISIKVPATCANMGPGFDCLGIALSLYNNFTFEETGGSLKIEGCSDEFKNEDNLIFTSYRKTLSILGYRYKGVKIIIDSKIPVSRGLGSSAACIAAGVAAANEIEGGKLTMDEILCIASDIEGHPDNVAPAILGGMTAAIMENGKVYYSSISIPEDITFCALIPDFRLSTKLARSVLPDTIPRADGVFNVGRASLLVAALSSGKTELLPIAFDDRLHQVYRKSLIKNYDYIVDKCIESGGTAAFLSGAGPTIMCILKNNDNAFMDKMESHLKKLPDRWSMIMLQPDLKGFRLYTDN
jgi:homoserine kinase